MNTLIYAPDQAGYSIGDSENRLSTEVGSIGAYRRNLINGNRFVDVTWQCSKAIYNYLAQAYRHFIESGGDPFLCSMFLDNANILEHLHCRFVPGSFGLTSVNGETYSVKAQLNVTPTKYDVDVLPFVNAGDLLTVSFKPNAGVYVLTGANASFRLSTIHMLANTGVYLLSGKDANIFPIVTKMPAATGSYSLTGNDAELSYSDKKLVAASGNYSVTGNNATLTKLSAATTWSPTNKGTNVTLSGGNLIANVVNDSQQARTTSGKSSGKYYIELLVGTLTGNYGIVGFADITSTANAILSSTGISYHGSDGSVDSGTGGATWATGDILGLTIDYTGSLAVFNIYKNNTLSVTKTAGISSTVWAVSVSQNYGTGASFPYTLRPNAASQTYSPPAGYSPWD